MSDSSSEDEQIAAKSKKSKLNDGNCVTEVAEEKTFEQLVSYFKGITCSIFCCQLPVNLTFRASGMFYVTFAYVWDGKRQRKCNVLQFLML